MGYWHVGVPPSGPMDHLAFRLANRLVGNPEGTAALEIAVIGPSLRFTSDSTIAITGGSGEVPGTETASMEVWVAVRPTDKRSALKDTIGERAIRKTAESFIAGL